MMKTSLMTWMTLLGFLLVSPALAADKKAATPAPKTDARKAPDKPAASAKTAASTAAKAVARVVPKPKPAPPTWSPSLKLGFNGSMVHSSSVPGVDDGFTIGLGIQLNGGLLYRKDNHKWNTTLKILHTQTKTPAVEFFVKTADELNFQTLYAYNFQSKKEASFFTAFTLNTAILPSDYIVSEDKDLIQKGTTTAIGKSTRTNPFRLTEGFNPMVLQLKAGLLIEPVKDKFFEMDMKLSATAQQIAASGFVVEDDTATAQIDLRKLENSTQAGLQFRVEVDGQLNKRVTYEFYVDLFYPIYSSLAKSDLQGFDLLSSDISLKVSLKMAAWASINYVFRAQRQPLLSENWQVTNNLVLSLKANIL